MQKQAVILIVDDVESNVKLLSSILKNDYQIEVARNGLEALDFVKQEVLPDLILLDIGMPEMDGYEVLEKLQRVIGINIPPVIFVTGNNTNEDEEKGLLLGAVDYIKKPFHSVIVKARVHTQIILKQQRDALSHRASHDQLTGLHNRNHLSDEGSRKFSRAKRTGDKLSVIMLDIDHFKQVNDTYGHLKGDDVLKEVASVLKTNKREEDFCARFGGEEFVVVLEGCSSKDAKIKAEELRKKIELLNPYDVRVTSSFGVCELNNKHEKFESLLRDADTVLYKAKENGRNKVIEFM